MPAGIPETRKTTLFMPCFPTTDANDMTGSCAHPRLSAHVASSSRPFPNPGYLPFFSKSHFLSHIVFSAVAFATPSHSVAQSELPGDEKRLAALIEQLGDASYDRRSDATRQLCALGPVVVEPLQVASRGENAEVALRARKILDAFDALLFAGTKITIEASANNFEWNQIVDLRVTIANTSKFASKIPFDESSATTVSGDAAQVANMIDISEWLEVKAPDGKAIELRVDDISEESAILDVIQARLGGGPTMMLQPNQTVVILGKAFNRGWARYPLLDRGQYAIRFEYIPQWQDPILASANVGKVTSETAFVNIKTEAPSAISRNGAEADLVVERAGDQIQARLVNRTDRLVRVNANFGPAAPFAEGKWTMEAGPLQTTVAVHQGKNPTWQDFAAQNIHEVQAGESIVLASASCEEILRRADEFRPQLRDATTLNIGFAYSNLCDRQWQARQGTTFANDPTLPAILLQPLPTRILSTRQTSNRITCAAP